MKAWLFQDHRQVAKVGASAASWYVGWIDPQGKRRSKSFGPGSEGKKLAFRYQKRVAAELLTGTYKAVAKATWAKFRAEYDAKVLDGMGPQTAKVVRNSLDQFERLAAPAKVASITVSVIDQFVAERRKERGAKAASVISPATINRDLRNIKAALNKAGEWGYLPTVPRIRMIREPKKLPTYVTPDHFAAIYGACDKARLPNDLTGVDPADWWRALLVLGYMTGWRISELLALKRDDLDLDGGYAITRAGDNKGRRDDRVKLHAVAVEHLRRVRTFDPVVLPWNYNRRTLHEEFLRAQEAAGIALPCHGDHTHTRFCRVYGFHDLRRAFATMNADKLTADALQALMRHKSYQTTQRYISMARQMDEAVEVLHVPDVLLAKNA
ncbi:MAG: site-specific integrase [Gemmataceae bacterium]